MGSYLAYLFKSTNAHGVHSPFIYGLLTECIYLRKTMVLPLKTMFKKQKYHLLIQRLFAYFSISNGKIIGNPIYISKEIVLDTSPHPEKYFLLYVSANIPSTDVLTVLKQYAHPKTIVLIEHIHQPDKRKIWETLKQNKDLTVTVDLHKLGLIFFRTEQKKQNFIIRF
ncbi:hypothetical protein [Ochrovirga pacifica]|uniref:hypothetical protein n=1 Tax=Ochrovirga pacifica TaxID=1042376 RepID=UPI0002F44177|nr:hypothetical protein [Ochrovirga pacifica]